jgi:hypothetical protein
MVSSFGLVQPASAFGKHDLHECFLDPEAQRLCIWWDWVDPYPLDSTKKIYYYMGAYFDPTIDHPGTMDCKVYLNDVEIPLRHYTAPIPNDFYWFTPGPYDFFGNHKGSPNSMIKRWYWIFEPGDFEPGTSFIMRTEFFYDHEPTSSWTNLIDVV